MSLKSEITTLVKLAELSERKQFDKSRGKKKHTRSLQKRKRFSDSVVGRDDEQPVVSYSEKPRNITFAETARKSLPKIRLLLLKTTLENRLGVIIELNQLSEAVQRLRQQTPNKDSQLLKKIEL